MDCEVIDCDALGGAIYRYKDMVGGRDVDAIINCQAYIEAPYSLTHPTKVFNYNVKTMLATLEFARKYDCRVICSSSNLVYGNPVYSPLDERHPLAPQSPYAASRVAQEMLTMSYFRSYGLPVTVLRYSNLYGPKGRGQN
ncbi:MAG: GDP-mannose 4,6-dehydratase [Candidatus Thermoplasmatota archaeon]|nr:GDP-mannose 4,6-dehydratase [Candidatus Thermoplasmatota archaeon]